MKNFMISFTTTIKTNLLKASDFITRNYLAAKLLALALITALLMPLIFFGEVYKTSAQIQTSTLKMNVPVPVSAPPQAFNLSSSDTISAKTLASVSSFNASIINVYGSFVNTVTAPVLPEGFEMAQPVSPLYQSISSSASSVGSTLGTFLGFSTTTAETTTNLLTTETANDNTEYDFDGDGDSDIARWSPSSGEWKIKDTDCDTSTTHTLGSSTSVLAPGDFDGDNKTDLAVFTSGTWTVKLCGSNTQYPVSFGTSGDIPVTGDYNRDGYSDYAIFRPSTSTFWVMNSQDYSYSNTAFGASGDIPVPGDYDGDGSTDIAVYRPSTGDWHIKQSSNNVTINPHWGVATDIPVPADYDGDGITDLSVYRPSSGTWFIYKSTNGSYIQQIWGNHGDQPTPGDYDGDGKADLSVWRPKTGVWFTYKSCNYDGIGCGTDPQYIYETLGMNGDVPVEAAYIKKIGGLVQDYDLAKLRLSPKNATGGTDLYSRNFSWGTGLVGLPGRAGLGAGFGISYNSLVWLKDTENNVMIFDPDQSNVSPGFKMGFPTIEPVYFDKDTERFSYLMVTPSGGRVEFQQTAASDTYETVDSSYVQLKTQEAESPNDPVDDIKITVTGTDGTQMNYEWLAGAFRCNRIRDRNGNLITIAHDEYGLLRTVTDTLGRVITVNYDTEFYPTSITQQWQTNNGEGSATTYTWATFGYTTLSMNPSFDSSLGVFGPTDGTVIKVLDKVVYGNPSSSSLNTGETRFEYNAFGQVKKVRNMAADGHELNYVITNLHTPGTDQPDVPRLSETKSWTENFNGGAEIILNNSITENQTIPEAGGTGTMIKVWMTNHPNSSESRSYVGSSDWMEGLPIVSEDWADNGSGVARQRWTQTTWAQDDEYLSYILNPRVIESKIGDNVSLKRTEIIYKIIPFTTIAEYGLVEEVRLYDGSNNLLKKSNTTYNLDNAYISKRIIGLPAQTEVSGFDQGTNQLKLVSKTTYNYDEGNFNDSNLEQNISTVIKHDGEYYSSSFIVGRGNLTSTTRWNVDYPTSSGEAVSSSVKYNIAGAVVARTDPLSRTMKISYADKYNDTTTSRNTFAYPTKLTDPAGNYSEIEYRFDIGANVRAKSPAPAGNNDGKETTREYDSIGRLLKEKIVNLGGAYIRYEYPTNQTQSKVYSTIIDTDNDGADADDEVLSESFTDGAGRVLKSRTIHPGSSGGFISALTEYDILGRVKRSSVPTETDSNWNPAGDDYTRGYLWKYQKYDWKGRVVRTINTDGTDSPTLNDSDQLFSYDGCGCAGGQITTIEGELVPRNDQSGNARRKQKIYEDILGRPYKTEIMNWDGSTVYTTTVQTFNGRDQVIKTRQYAGNTGSSTYQDITTTFDGHGRLKTRHYPIEDTQTDTIWIYNTDDSVQQVIDPRGAITNFTYNDSRGLLTQISYDPPGNPPQNIVIPDTPNVNFTYDAPGNRTSMTDGTGTTDYVYDELSRITSETKDFTDLEDDLTLGYTYHLGGELKSITDPFGAAVNYAHDKTGRLTSVAGTSFGNNTSGNYVDQIQYRAFGAIKQMNYKTDDNALVAMQYDNRLRVSTYEVASSAVTGGFVQKSGFEYNADSRPKEVDNVINAGFDRTFKYDFAGRLTNNQFGIGTRPDDQQFTTYSQTIAYDAFSNMTSRQTNIWSGSEGFTATYVNGRRQAMSGETLVFDAAGNLVDITSPGYFGRERYERNKFDAAGQMTEFSNRRQVGGGQTTLHDLITTTTQFYDGNGERVKESERHESTQAPAPPGVPQPVITEQTKYFVRSTVTGKIITELDGAGGKRMTKVYLGSAVLAEQRVFSSTSSEVIWQHGDPVTGSVQPTLKSGAVSIYVGTGRRELEPLGGIVPTHDPYYAGEDFNIPTYEFGGDVRRPEYGCTLPDTGQPAPCTVAAGLMNYLDGISLNWISKWGYKQQGQDRQTIPDFIRADNRRDDEYERIEGMRIHGLRYAAQSRGRDFVGYAWVVDNSTAAQTQQSGNKGRPELGQGIPEHLKYLVLGLASFKKCGETFEQLIQIMTKKFSTGKAGGNSIVENVYDSLKSVKIIPTLNSVGRNIGKGIVSIRDNYNNDSRGEIFTWQQFALVTLQEMLHQAGSDTDLRKASFELYNSGNLDQSVKDLIDKIYPNSGGNLYEHAILSAACAFPDYEVFKLWFRKRRR